tara:strand:- start:349 stop:1305 length:957 start_codon:yes stop_codon:yes gene_type:complete
MIYSKIIGVGNYLPKKILTNDDLSNIVDTSDSWIFSRTGIKQRHIADDGEYTSDLAIMAAKDALNNAQISSKKIDYIICATTTPDRTFPATACKLQNYFKIATIPTFDIQAVCSGFIYSLHVADALIKSQKAKYILVVGAETLSKIVDWKDRRTCVLFGDGAGAVILSSSEEKSGILSSNIFSDGSWQESLYADGGPSLNQKVGKIRMKGQDIFKLAVNKLAETTLKSIHECKKKVSDVDWFIPHQANVRIIDGTAKKIGISMDRVVKTINKHANTSAASIPLALSNHVKNGSIKRKDLLALCAIGGGLSWGSCVIKF